MNTNWSTPKTNAVAAILDLRKALASGHKARLVRARNEDCEYPIKLKKANQDFRNWEFGFGTISTRRDISKASNMDEFEKYLSLNYKACYGAPEAVERYYKTGKLSADNFKGMGMSHLVKVEDMIIFYKLIGNTELAEMYGFQYYNDKTGDDRHFFDFFRLKRGESKYTVKHFRRKLWVVELLGKADDKPRIPWLIAVLNVVLYPLKYIPRRSVLRMDDYTNYTYRIGGVMNGFSVEFQIPKKFGFN